MESSKRKRADSGELSTHARITYHAGPRAFERLFKEHSLQELKEVVQRKLGLGSGMVVKLKQMRSNALLDLDDDDDFEALRAQALRDASSTIDIRVTVEEDQSKVSTASTAVVDSPQQPVPVTSRGAGPVTKKRKVAFGDDATETTPKAAAHHTARNKDPSEELMGQARGKKVKSPPKDVRSAAEPTQETLAQPEPEADNVPTADIEVKHADEPPKKKHRRTKDKVVTPSSEPPTGESLKDKQASKSGEMPPSADNIGEPVRVAERPTDDRPAEAVSSASTKKSTQLRKSKSQTSLKSGDAGGGEERSPKPTKSKVSKKSTAKGVKSAGTSKTSEAATKDGTSELSLSQAGQSAALATGSLENDRSKPDYAGTASYPVSKKSSKKTSGSGPGVDMPEKKSNGGDGVVAGEGRVSNASPSNPTLLDAEAWNELLQKFRDDVAELQNQEGSPSAQSETAKKLVSVKKSRRSIASSTAISSSKHTPAQPTGLGSTETPSLPNHHGSVSTAHAPSKSPSNDSSCPVCLQKPFHVLHDCPIVLKGPDVIQQRLNELRHSDVRDSQEFIGELEALIRQHKDSETATTAHNSLPDEASCETTTHSLPVASSPSQSLTLCDLPGDSHFTDVVGSSNEESSAESSDENGGRIAQTIYPPKPSVTRGPMSYGDDMLEAVVRGPASRRVVTDILKELQEEEETQQQGFALSSRYEDGEHPRSSSSTSNGDRSSHSITSHSAPTAGAPRGQSSLDSKDAREAPRGADSNRCKTMVSSRDHTELHDDADSSRLGLDTYSPGVHPIKPNMPPPRTVDESDIVSQSTPKRSMKRDKLSVVAVPSANQKAKGKPKVLNSEPLPSPAFVPKATNLRGNKETKASTKGMAETPVAKPSIKGTTSGVTTNGHMAPTPPSLVMWETMRELTPSVQYDELASSSSQVEEHHSPANKTKADRLNNGEMEILNGKERLFDLTPSQIPFPYSQYTPPQVLAPQSSEIDKNSGKAPSSRRPPQKSGSYRSLTVLASEASSLFPSSLPTPRATTVNGKASKEDVTDDTSDDDGDSSSSETDDPTLTTHIPVGRRASSTLPSKKKKGLLQGL